MPDYVPAHFLQSYHVCPREVWLHAHGIRMEHTSDTVSEGRLIAETTYPQRSQKYRELDLGMVKIDHYDPKNKVVHEVKKSDRTEEAHRWQLKYYLWVLEQMGVEGPTGILEYPRLRKREEVFLSDPDRHYLIETVEKIRQLIDSDQCPPLLNKPICKRCSYYEFCYSE